MISNKYEANNLKNKIIDSYNEYYPDTLTRLKFRLKTTFPNKKDKLLNPN